MVTRYLLLSLLAVAVVACSETNSNNSAAEVADSSHGTAGVSAGDVVKGEEIPLDQITFDTLRLRLNTNDRFTYRIRMASTMGQDTNEVVKNEEFIVKEVVTKINSDGNAVVRMQYTSMNVQAKFQNSQTKSIIFQTAFNSAKATDLKDSTKQQFAVMVNAPIDITITPKAFIKNIEGIEPIARKIAATSPGNAISPLAPDQFNQLKDMIKETMVATFIATTLAPLPDSTLSSKGEWTRTQSQSMNPVLSSNSVTTYKVGAVKKVNGHRLAIIEGTMSGKINIVQGPPGAPSPQFKFTTASIKGASTIVVDLDTGVLVSNKGNAHSEIIGTMTFPGGEPRPVSQVQELNVDTELLP